MWDFFFIISYGGFIDMYGNILIVYSFNDMWLRLVDMLFLKVKCVL